ncbi:helix-turn-helix transcriptional regulator [Azospirillum picis]|uniref:AraC-like DNA-binding protein n=1 Tax=Azospirillum picis TaxID=488438 RepID=A0ABU0MRC2_9PROT|nr:AraC family transcriptional regulator [Azospirillum picis]MBP2302455.1 AraC-like DNA-binding protein [Azospirillum picis]MDQ0536034.1 AraC-like DNA-binding protein [Azospirillum picis]
MARVSKDVHRFWRDPALPHLEARSIQDGREVCYDWHSHSTFSIGLVTGGVSEFRIGLDRHRVSAGTTVLMNPDEPHACNPLDGLPWSYRMLYVDTAWLAHIQGEPAFRPYAPPLSRDPALGRRMARLFGLLFDPAAGSPEKEAAVGDLFATLRLALGGLPAGPAAAAQDAGGHAALERAADFITAHCTQPLRLADIAGAAGLSPSYLVRSFKARFGLTPHAYQINRRIQFGQRELRLGRPIVEVALDAGFADQAHFQRAFKRHVAATPGQYMRRDLPA